MPDKTKSLLWDYDIEKKWDLNVIFLNQTFNERLKKFLTREPNATDDAVLLLWRDVQVTLRDRQNIINSHNFIETSWHENASNEDQEIVEFSELWKIFIFNHDF